MLDKKQIEIILISLAVIFLAIDVFGFAFMPWWALSIPLLLGGGLFRWGMGRLM